MINITTETTAAIEDKENRKKRVDEAKNQIQAQQKLDAQSRVVQREMAHRIKNILSMTMAVVSQTLRHYGSLEEAAETISKRIAALSNAQDVLTNARSDDADVATLIGEVLSPHLFEVGRITLTGPNLLVPTQAAFAVMSLNYQDVHCCVLCQARWMVSRWPRKSGSGGRILLSSSCPAIIAHQTPLQKSLNKACTIRL